MAAVAINYFAYNFIKIHSSLRMSLAMAAASRIGCSTCRISLRCWSNRRKKWQ
jgi:hypothetical protein